MKYIFNFLFYGFLLTTIIGLSASWLDRKITARLQYRVGPPFLQPFIDIMKLLGKETLIPKGSSSITFLFAPVLSFAGVMIVATLLWINTINLNKGFLGDIIVVLYLLMLPSIGLLLGGFSSRNPLASLGASREMKLILSYELPFLLAILVPVIKSGLSIKVGEILSFQSHNGVIIGSFSGFLAFLVCLICIQAKLGLVPFDIAEAETEITAGPLIDYSGTPLAIYRLTKNMLLFVLPFFLIILFMGGIRFSGVHILFGILKYIGLVLLITVIRNTNPRIRIDQAVKFFWLVITPLAVISTILALIGK